MSHGLLRRFAVVRGAIERGDVSARHIELLETLSPLSTSLEEEGARTGDAVLTDVGAIVAALMVAIARADAKPKKVRGRNIVGPFAKGREDLDAMGAAARRVLSRQEDLNLRTPAGQAWIDMVEELAIALRGDGPHEREETELALVAVKAACLHYGVTYDAAAQREPMIEAARDALNNAQGAPAKGTMSKNEVRLIAEQWEPAAQTLARSTLRIMGASTKNIGRKLKIPPLSSEGSQKPK